MTTGDRAHNSIDTCIGAKTEAVEVPSQNVMRARLVCFAQPGQTATKVEMKLGKLTIDGRSSLENLQGAGEVRVAFQLCSFPINPFPFDKRFVAQAISMQ